MAEQIKGSKKGTSINPSPSGGYGRGACYPEIGKETQQDVSKYRPNWASEGSAAKAGPNNEKVQSPSHVGKAFNPKRS